jgi:hypothetical protein
MLFDFLSYCLQYFFLVLCASCFNDNMRWRGSIFVKSVWCPGGFLYLNGHLFLKIWKIFNYYFVEYIFRLHLFSFFNDLIQRFGLLKELLNSCIFLLQLLNILSKNFSVFFSFFSKIKV